MAPMSKANKKRNDSNGGSTKKAAHRPSVISLFSGALGLDLGLEKAGFEVRLAVECNGAAANTIRANKPELPLIEKRLEKVTTKELLRKAGLARGETTVIVGGPCCQSFSTAGQRNSVGDPRGKTFKEFLRVVKEARPRFFIIENVRGVASAACKHRPLAKRGPGNPALRPEEELGSAFVMILKELKKTGYHVQFNLYNAADFGVPQTRERLLFIGSREGVPIDLPRPTHSATGEDGRRPWVTLREALKGLIDPKPACPSLIPSKRRYLKLIPAGGNWRKLPKRMQKSALGRAYKSWGGRSGFLRRLSWDRPAPALTTNPVGKATMMCHPRQLRALSVRECARLQQFPDNWVFKGGLNQQYTQVGNAVPVGLGHAVGLALRRTLKQRSTRSRNLLGIIGCPDRVLIDRMADGHRTVLNPSRMRRYKNPEAARRWLRCDGRSPIRRKIRELVRHVPTNGTVKPKPSEVATIADKMRSPRQTTARKVRLAA